MATNASATITPAVVNGSEMPNQSSQVLADQPAPAEHQQQRHAADHRRQHERHGHERAEHAAARAASPRASSQASGTPSSRQTTVASARAHQRQRSACPTSALNSAPGSVDQGARTSSPTSGTSEERQPEQRRQQEDEGQPPARAPATTTHGASKPAAVRTALPSSDST